MTSMNWAVPILLKDGRSEIGVNYKTSPTGTVTKQYKTTGGLALLIASNQQSITPLGIVLDRMEEYPHELETDVETRTGIINWLRKEYP